MEINPIVPIQVISNYTNIIPSGNNEIVTNVKHVKNNGSVRVEEIDYIKYNKNGELVKFTPQSTADITI